MSTEENHFYVHDCLKVVETGDKPVHCYGDKNSLPKIGKVFVGGTFAFLGATFAFLAYPGLITLITLNDIWNLVSMALDNPFDLDLDECFAKGSLALNHTFCSFCVPLLCYLLRKAYKAEEALQTMEQLQAELQDQRQTTQDEQARSAQLQARFRAQLV